VKHADFIVISWVLSFVPIALYAWRNARRARRLDPFVEKIDKPWT
jgi:hypothetical protein